MEQIKGTAENQERIIAAYRDTRSDPDLAEQLLMAVGVGGTTSTSTIYENYLDGLHGSNLETGEFISSYTIHHVTFNWLSRSFQSNHLVLHRITLVKATINGT